MERIIPSKMRAQTPVVQLGSTEAVLAALPDGGTIIVPKSEDRFRIRALLQAAGRSVDDVKIIPATMASYDEVMFQIPKERVIGVDVGAFDAEMPTIYRRAYAHLARFKTVHWG